MLVLEKCRRDPQKDLRRETFVSGTTTKYSLIRSARSYLIPQSMPLVATIVAQDYPLATHESGAFFAKTVVCVGLKIRTGGVEIAGGSRDRE